MLILNTKFKKDLEILLLRCKNDKKNSWILKSFKTWKKTQLYPGLSWKVHSTGETSLLRKKPWLLKMIYFVYQEQHTKWMQS